MIDYYRVLRIPYSSTAKEIKQAYLTLALKYHPDVNATPDAAKHFKGINEAYEHLKCDTKRAEFLRHRTGDSDIWNPHAAERQYESRGNESRERKDYRDKVELMFAFERLVHPMSLLLVVLPTTLLLWYLTSSRAREEEERVLAWYNPSAQRWEKPAPWDAHFRALNPVVEMVEKSLVHEPSSRRGK